MRGGGVALCDAGQYEEEQRRNPAIILQYEEGQIVLIKKHKKISKKVLTIYAGML
jgi:hypothetical protein